MEGWQRWSPVSGILFVALFAVAVVVLGSTGDTPEEVREYYADNEGRVFTSFFILVASALALLWFVTTAAASRSDRREQFVADVHLHGEECRCADRRARGGARVRDRA
jgi:hypothetical protein